jgi:hypothetical protein
MTKTKKKVHNQFPPGWDEERVRRVIDYYDAQTEDEALAEDEAVFAGDHHTLMEIPAELVPTIRELIAKHLQDHNPDAR